MFTPGNLKLGYGRVWGFAIPPVTTCPGRSKVCAQECYAVGSYRRPGAAQRWQHNLRLARRRDFGELALAAIRMNGIRVLRWMVSGDIYSVPFARKLLWVMRRTRHVKHWLYTRSWRVPEIRPWLEKMARLGHVKVWFSCDRETGVPQGPVPRRVRLCWMQATHDDLPPEGVALAFRIRRLRQVPTKRIGLTLVCPPEQGVPRRVEIHCDSCGICWR